MTKTPIPKLITVLAVPTILSMLVTAVYNMADTFFIGRIKAPPEQVTAAVGAASVVFSVMAVLQAFGFFFGQGSGNFIARALGDKNRSAAEAVATFGFVSAILFGVILCVLGLVFIKPLARALASSETILPYAVRYMRYVLIAAPFLCGSFVLNNQLRFQGNALIAMIGIVSGAVINVGLDALLILVFQMDTDGAGLATAIGQACGFFVLYAGTRRGDNVKIRVFSYRFRWSYAKEILRGGTPALARQGLSGLSAVCLNLAARGCGGDAAVAAMGIVSRVMSFCFSSVLGLGQGFQPVCGYNYGAKRYARVKRGFFFCMEISFSIFAVVAAAMIFFAPRVVASFRDDADVIRVGVAALRLQCAAFACVPLITYTNMMLQTIGKAVPATLLSMARQGFFFIPAVFVLPSVFGVGGLVSAQPAADLLSFVPALFLAAAEIRRLNALEKAALREDPPPEEG